MTKATLLDILSTAGYWEPDEPRGSRPVLRERGGETPPRHSPRAWAIHASFFFDAARYNPRPARYSRTALRSPCSLCPFSVNSVLNLPPYGWTASNRGIGLRYRPIHRITILLR